MLKAYKYQLNPTKAQKTFMDKSFGSCRYIYNWALERKSEAYKADGTNLSYDDLQNELPSLKKEKIWLKDVSAQSLQASVRCLDVAYTNFFKYYSAGVRHPKYKSKHKSRNSCKFEQGNNGSAIRVDFNSNVIVLPKMKEVRFYKSRGFTGTIRSATISKTPTGKYYVSVLVQDGLREPSKPTVTEQTSVGVDVGLTTYATLSTGEEMGNPRFFEKTQKQLAYHQQKLSRLKNKQKGEKYSNRYAKQRLRVAKIHEKIRNQRENYLHHLSKKLVCNPEFDTIFIEDLNVKGMMKNHKLAKSIGSASWSSFFTMLEYKSNWYGKNVIKIGRYEPSSKTCGCGYINKELSLKDREWTCPQCKSRNQRDFLAAQNIKKFGLQDLEMKKIPMVNGEKGAGVSQERSKRQGRRVKTL